MRRYSRFLVLISGLTLLFCVQPAFSQTSEESKALQKDIEALKEGQAGLEQDLQDLKEILGFKPAAAPPAVFKEAVINIKGAPIKGDKNAKLVFIEFSDYQ